MTTPTEKTLRMMEKKMLRRDAVNWCRVAVGVLHPSLKARLSVGPGPGPWPRVWLVVPTNAWAAICTYVAEERPAQVLLERAVLRACRPL